MGRGENDGVGDGGWRTENDKAVKVVGVCSAHRRLVARALMQEAEPGKTNTIARHRGGDC